MAMVGMVTAELVVTKVGAIESRAKALLESAVGRPCVRVEIGLTSVTTEWLTAEDAARAAVFFGSEMRRATRLSYDAVNGWTCEATEGF